MQNSYRSAVSIYSKFLYRSNFKFTGNHNWNFGLVTGYYIHTHVEGKVDWWAIQEGPDYHSSRIIEGDDKAFFKSFYFGLVSSFQFNFKKVRFLKPGIELSFYPKYANIAADYSNNKNMVANRSMFMGSVILGLGSKKLPNEIEK